MAKKKVKAAVKMRLSAGAATAAPPVGSMLGQHQVNLMDFVKKFNALTADKKAMVLPVEVTVYVDKTFEMRVKGQSVTDMIKKAIKLAKGSSAPGKTVGGSISKSAIEEIAKEKMSDMAVSSLDAAKKCIMGSVKSMGLVVTD